MANDRDRLDENQNELDRKEADKSGRDRTIGKGMTSPDSTQMPLKAETGEPDWDAVKGRVGSDDADEERNDR